MKTPLFPACILFLAAMISHAQPIPADSLYLGQTPPGTTPVVFSLAIPAGSFDAERIAISSDGKEIFYTDIHGYYPTAGDTIRCYRYTSNHWTGPFTLFPGYLAPALSVSSDTLWFQHNGTTYETYFSTRTLTGWSIPQRILAGLNHAHYYQVTNNGNGYISSVSDPTTGAADWCRLQYTGSDTVAATLGLPVNSSGDNLDFFVARNENFMILAKNGLKISYHKDDGNWTNPKSLGTQINFGLGMWGPWVTSDDTYLFYTTGTLPDYSDTHVYWVRVDALIDSLRYTNFIPYLKNRIPDQQAIRGEPFLYALTDTTFIDDDGNNTLTYQATLINGTPLPSWLSFDTISGVFTGIPVQTETLQIRVTATDTAGATAWTTLKITVGSPVSTGAMMEHAPAVNMWPNPTHGILYVEVAGSKCSPAPVGIINSAGSIVARTTVSGTALIDLSDQPRGSYLARILTAPGEVTCRIVRY